MWRPQAADVLRLFDDAHGPLANHFAYVATGYKREKIFKFDVLSKGPRAQGTTISEPKLALVTDGYVSSSRIYEAHDFIGPAVRTGTHRHGLNVSPLRLVFGDWDLLAAVHRNPSLDSEYALFEVCDDELKARQVRTA